MKLIVSLAILLNAAPATAEPYQAPVILRISRGFRSPPVLEKEVTSKGKSVMQLLREHATVKTAYGGGFVTAINGIAAGEGRHWFYYVNGALSNTGADGYIPQAGDFIQWDFHPWKGGGMVGALIGAFPQPFAGTGKVGIPVEIYSSEHLRERAEKLKVSLMQKGGRALRLKSLEKAPEKSGSSALYIGSWDKIVSIPPIKMCYGNRKKHGVFFEFENDTLHALDFDLKRRSHHRPAGLLCVLHEGFMNKTPLWIIAGTDTKSTRNAADILIHHPEQIRGMAGAIVAGGKIIPLPVSTP